MLAGVCGGLGESLDLDPIVLRLLFIALAIIHPIGAVILYLIAALLMPPKPGEPGGLMDVRRVGDVVIGFVLTVVGFWVLTAALTSSIIPGVVREISFPQFFNAVSLLVSPTVGLIGLLMLAAGLVFVWRGLRRRPMEAELRRV